MYICIQTYTYIYGINMWDMGKLIRNLSRLEKQVKEVD